METYSSITWKDLSPIVSFCILVSLFLVDEEPKDQESSNDDSDEGEEEDASSEEDDAMQHLSGFVEINVTCIK